MYKLSFFPISRNTVEAATSRFPCKMHPIPKVMIKSLISVTPFTAPVMKYGSAWEFMGSNPCLK